MNLADQHLVFIVFNLLDSVEEGQDIVCLCLLLIEGPKVVGQQILIAVASMDELVPPGEVISVKRVNLVILPSDVHKCTLLPLPVHLQDLRVRKVGDCLLVEPVVNSILSNQRRLSLLFVSHVLFPVRYIFDLIIYHF